MLISLGDLFEQFVANFLFNQVFVEKFQNEIAANCLSLLLSGRRKLSVLFRAQL